MILRFGCQNLKPLLDAAKQASDDGDKVACYIELGGFVWCEYGILEI
ncbi:MAG: hypothetical protein Q4D62_05270 [Planctomycetia bacterium]|nr:hypothetical protein [Planctomycetia bacterium]